MPKSSGPRMRELGRIDRTNFDCVVYRKRYAHSIENWADTSSTIAQFAA